MGSTEAGEPRLELGSLLPGPIHPLSTVSHCRPLVSFPGCIHSETSPRRRFLVVPPKERTRVKFRCHAGGPFLPSASCGIVCAPCCLDEGFGELEAVFKGGGSSEAGALEGTGKTRNALTQFQASDPWGLNMWETIEI